jgi:general secretion pathway protein N
MRSFVLVLVTSILIVAMAPATLIDQVVSNVSQGALRISEAEGSVWSGRGLLNVIDLASQERRPWRRIRWSFDPIGLFRGELAWQIISRDVETSRLAIGIPGWQVVDFAISGPAQNLLQRIPGPLGKLGWDGDVDLKVGSLNCSWRGECGGQMEAQWIGAGSDFLPGKVFGDYRIEAKGVGGEFALSWDSTKASNVRTSGTGKIAKSGAISLNGTVTGDPELLSRLPAIAGPWAKPTASRDTWRIVFP